MYLRSEVEALVNTVNVYRLIMHEETRNLFSAYYTYAFDMAAPCGGCPGELEVGIAKLKWLMTRHQPEHETLQKAMTLTKYRMKSNTRLYSFKLMTMVTPANCTDSIAEALIAENPKHADFFIVNGPVLEATKPALTVGTPAELIPVGNQDAAPVKTTRPRKRRK